MDQICKAGIYQNYFFMHQQQILTRCSYQQLFLNQKDDIKPKPQENQLKKQLFEILSSILNNINLGFNYKTSPNKDCLVKIVHILQKNHEVFQKPQKFQQSIQMTEHDFQLLQSLDTSMKPKQIRFCRRTEQQKMDMRMKKKERKLKRIERQIREKEAEVLFKKKQLKEAKLKALATELKRSSMAENYEVIKQKRQVIYQSE